MRDGAIVTTKQDTEEHGYGIKSIKSIAELYGGTADCFVEDSIFTWWSPSPAGKAKKKLHNPKATAFRQSLCFCVICAVFFDVCANSIDPVNASLYDSFVKKI
ncbi:MAG: GHKL domain-containing protein [Gemmiger formicilis]|uniref:GHKL domain-containing protein n=1 Tax=Gemmiger formicilis TaxID=745368 RepID=UPI0039A2AC69